MSEQLPPVNPGYEASDVPTPPVWRFLGYLVLITFAAIGLMYGMFQVMKSYNEARDAEPTVMEQQRTLPSGARLQVNEPWDLKQFKAKEEQILTSYGWEDKSVNAVRIPVARAMEIVAGKGLPKFEVPPVKAAAAKEGKQ